MPLTRSVVCWSLGLAVGLSLSLADQAQSAQTTVPEFLYQLAQEHRKAHRDDEAIHELRKLLLLDPHHSQARQELALLEQKRMGSRARVVDETLGRVEASRRGAREGAIDQAVRQAKAPPVVPEAAEVPPKQPLADRMKLPGLPSLPLAETVAPLEQTRREVLVAPVRPGFERFYKEGIGFQPVPGLGLSGRTEIFEDPNDVDDFILESKILNFSEISQFRRSILPLFIRSSAGRVTLDYEPLPRFNYEYDARETLHEFETRFGVKDIDRQTHAVNALYSFPRIPYLGILTVNPWYKRVLQESDHDAGSNEHWNETVLNFSLQPTENIEYFFQLDAYDAHKKRIVGRTKQREFRGELRLRVPQLRLFLIPGYAYLDEDFDPGDDEFTRRRAFIDWGFDITKRLRASSKEIMTKSEVSQPGKQPSNPDAETFSMRNALSYTLFRDFYVSLGIDYAKGFGFSNFNNIGLRFEIELFKPGLIRSKLGYEWLSYYNISDDLHLLFWKFFLFQ